MLTWFLYSKRIFVVDRFSEALWRQGKKELVRFLTDCGLREHKYVIKEGRTKYDQVIYAQHMMSVQTGDMTILARHRIQVSYASAVVIRQSLVERFR